MFNAKLYGRELLTDNETLAEILNSNVMEGPRSIAQRIESEFAGLKETVVRAFKELDAKQAPASLILYVNFRVQAWAGRQFDVAPSEIYVYIPPNYTMDPAGASQQQASGA